MPAPLWSEAGSTSSADGDRELCRSTVAERFDPRTNRWEKLPSLPLGAGGLAVVAAGNRVVALGGGDDGEDWVTPATWSFDPDSNRWQRLADLRLSRHGHAAAALGADAYAFGGSPCPGYAVTDTAEGLEVEAAPG